MVYVARRLIPAWCKVFYIRCVRFDGSLQSTTKYKYLVQHRVVKWKQTNLWNKNIYCTLKQCTITVVWIFSMQFFKIIYLVNAYKILFLFMVSIQEQVVMAKYLTSKKNFIKRTLCSSFADFALFSGEPFSWFRYPFSLSSYPTVQMGWKVI